jgi:hypothetical protein
VNGDGKVLEVAMKRERRMFVGLTMITEVTGVCGSALAEEKRMVAADGEVDVGKKLLIGIGEMCVLPGDCEILRRLFGHFLGFESAVILRWALYSWCLRWVERHAS